MLQIAIRRDQESEVRDQENKKNHLTSEAYTLQLEKGFTLLEMLVTLAAIAAILIFAYSPDLELSNAKSSFNNTTEALQRELSTIRNESLTRNTTTKIIITSTNGVYTITTYYSPTPVTTCTAAGTWTQILSRTISVHAKYQITGAAAMNGTCFYRDGSASGGVFTISPKTVYKANGNQNTTVGATNTLLKTTVITVTIATGYLDVVTQ